MSSFRDLPLHFLLVVAPTVGACDLAFGLERPACVSTRDEDADGIPDDCDRCPGDPDEENSDGDRDGVGDVCDPEPDQTCQRRALFDDFTRADLPDRLATEEWMFDDDAIQPLVAANLSTLQYPVFSRSHVRASITIDGFDDAVNVRFVEIGAVLDIASSTSFTAGFTCRLVMAGTAHSVRIVEHASDTNLAMGAYNGDTVFERVRFSLDAAGAPLMCVVAKPNGIGMASVDPPEPRLTGLVALRVQHAAVRVHWVDIIEDVEEACP